MATVRYYLGAPYEGVYLTQREFDCVRFLKQGMRYKEMAERMGLTTRTVEFYVGNLRSKVYCRHKRLLAEQLDGVRIRRSIHNTILPCNDGMDCAA